MDGCLPRNTSLNRPTPAAAGILQSRDQILGAGSRPRINWHSRMFDFIKFPHP